jgi:hypothetical protein
LRERLKDGAPAVLVTEKAPAKSKAIPKWMRNVAGGGLDPDGQVLNPSAEQRGMAGRLSAISPRGPSV